MAGRSAGIRSTLRRPRERRPGRTGAAGGADRYRPAPDAPAPAAVEDAYAGLRGLAARAAELDVDADRIAVGGATTGGGTAAALALLAHDRGEVRPAHQLLVHPMLDDRTVLRTDLRTRSVRVWTPTSNRSGWSAYLGAPAFPRRPALRRPGPARRPERPAAGVDRVRLARPLPRHLFHDEDVAHAHRLRTAGCPCRLHLVHGAFHGFDALFPRAGVSRAIWSEQARALRDALLG